MEQETAFSPTAGKPSMGIMAEENMVSGAEFDPTRRYRYLLWREWGRADHRVLFVLLNPSTADEQVNDPTIRRCLGFARTWGYGAMDACNLFAYRTPYPAALREASAPVGPDNDKWIEFAVKRAATVVVAWGVHGALMGRHESMIQLLSRWKPLYCFGRTQQGFPKHPLYLPSAQPLILYAPP